MSNMLNETYTLSNGVTIPKLGLGTWFIDDDKAAQAVRDAVAIGYRNIDTAEAYGNERGVGEGIRTCGVDRKDIFVLHEACGGNQGLQRCCCGHRRVAAQGRTGLLRPHAHPCAAAVERLPRRRLRRRQPRGLASSRRRLYGRQAASNRRRESHRGGLGKHLRNRHYHFRRSTKCWPTRAIRHWI